MEEDYYNILNVTKSSSPEEIKKAYRKLILKVHPDKNNYEDEEIFNHLTMANQILTNTLLREKYDNWLKSFGQDSLSHSDLKHGYKNSIDKLNLQIADRKSQLDVSFQSLLRSLSLIEKEKQTAAAVSKLSKDQLRNEIERFKLGKSTSYQISQYQQDVVEAEQQEILIRIRQEKIGVDLLALTGEFKEKYELSQE